MKKIGLILSFIFMFVVISFVASCSSTVLDTQIVKEGDYHKMIFHFFLYNNNVVSIFFLLYNKNIVFRL